MKKEMSKASLILKKFPFSAFLISAFLTFMIVSLGARSQGLYLASYHTDDPVFLDREEQCFEDGCFQDLDGDNLNDEQEELLAHHFRPYLSFDPYENALLDFEPVVLYQVHPADPNEILISEEDDDEKTGYDLCRKENYQDYSTLCHGIYVRYMMYWALDGGGTPETYDCGHCHLWDTQSFEVWLRSEWEEGHTWAVEKAYNGWKDYYFRDYHELDIYQIKLDTE